MTTETQKHIPWYLWPFAALWKLLAVIVEMTGRFRGNGAWHRFYRCGHYYQFNDCWRDHRYSTGDHWIAVAAARDVLERMYTISRRLRRFQLSKTRA